jgi:hypothetical protein
MCRVTESFVGLIRGEAVENRSPAWLGKRVVDILDASLRSAGTGKSEKIASRLRDCQK